MIIFCHRSGWLIFATIRSNTLLISSTTSTQLASMRWNRKWCKSKHAQTCLYYDQITWLLL